MSVSSYARAASVNDLPKMKVTLPLSIQGEYGLNMGEAWWMDAREVLFWSPEKMPGGRDLLTRVDFHRGMTIDVTLRILDSEVPARFRNGYVHIARYIPRAPEDHKRADEQLRALNPKAFSKDYIPPRLPESISPGAAAPAPKEEKKGPSEAELVRQKLSADLAEAGRVIDQLRTRRWRTRIFWSLMGVGLGAVIGLAAEQFRTVRLLAWRQQPKLVLEYNLLAGAPLAGQDFSSAKLAGVDLRRADLAGSTLAGADLQGAKLAGANLQRADLAGARLSGANLGGAKLAGASFAGADLRGADVTTDTDGADFRGALFSNDTRWVAGRIPAGAFGPGAQSAGAALDEVSVVAADLEGIKLAGASLQRANLEKSTLVAADLGGARVTGTSFTGADFSKARMVELSCAPCTLREARLDGANLQRADLRGADLGASRGAGISLVGADLSRADLRGAEWASPDLRGAKLVGAKLSGAKLSQCLLLAADLSDADLVGARLDSCVADQRTLWPANVSPGALGAVVASPGALLQGAKLAPGSDLREQNLTAVKANRLEAPQVDFARANLDAADLSEANLKGGEFAGAMLRRADMRKAELGDARFAAADLTGAVLDGALICGADFSTAKIERVRFEGAVACVTTRWPRNVPPKGVTFQ